MHPTNQDRSTTKNPIPLLLFFLILMGAVCVGGYFAVGAAGNLLLKSIPPEKEAEWFRSLPFETGDANLRQGSALQSLLEKIPQAGPLKLEARYLCHGGLNAFAIPGGTIVVGDQVVAKLKSENGLMFVLAHEVGHFIHRDHLRGLGRMVAFAFFGAALGVGNQAFLANVLEHLVSTKYSRDQERAADTFAVETIKKIYGSLSGADEFLRAAAETSKNPIDGSLAFLSTHPGTQERLDYLAAHKKALPESKPIPLAKNLKSVCH